MHSVDNRNEEHHTIDVSSAGAEQCLSTQWQYRDDEFDTAVGTGTHSSHSSTCQARSKRQMSHNHMDRAILRRLKSFSPDEAMSRTHGGHSSAYVQARPTTQRARVYQLRDSLDSPDLLNSRQLRRRAARYSDFNSQASNDGVQSEEASVSSECPNDGTSGPTVLQSLQNAARASWFNILLVFVPLGFLAHYLQWPVIAVFVLNYLAIVPLSALMGFATEEVSIRLGTTWGGVVSATFGNMVELIIAVIALIEEEYRIVQAGLIGSVLSNTLLVLGCAFLAGGFRHRVQLFHVEAAQCAGSLLALSVLSMIIPAAYHGVHASGGEITNGILVMSRGTALILLLVYLLFLVFQLKTHSDIFDGSQTHAKDIKGGGMCSLGLSPTLTNQCCCMGGCVNAAQIEPGSTDERKSGHGHLHSGPQMKLWMAATLLVSISVLVAMASDILVDSVEELTKHYAISHTFVGMILLPIAASASEHAMSVTVAMRDKMDLCITVAVGTSMQMALFVLPVLIIIAWIMNRPLTLFFDDFETTTMLISVLVINYLIMNGRSNWLKGAMLLSSYFIVALAFFLYPYDVDDPKATISVDASRSGIL
ncbi:hypothetical protein GGH18_001073 [Coemansia sp. RSA 530]|nr:hypothetical protein GGH18_001073 [Coemansia sp. RSA 530]KAJ2257927.1 hypothetical protein GGH98_000537 [Coemansia sp. RSA 454]KAJ2406919.1 hypothetical protein J3F80_003196 [Coemansia sp. RSA 2526]